MENGSVVGFIVGKLGLVCLLPFLVLMQFYSTADCSST